MDIKLPLSLLSQYLETSAKPEEIAEALSLCGPTVDRLHKTDKDYVMDIEVITNRIDSVSALGVAREASAILPQFKHSAKLVNNPLEETIKSLGDLPSNQPVQFQVLDQSLLPRLTCISLSNIKVGESDENTKELLELSGQRPINNVVDISNELALRLGQPVHIFDLDKIKGQKMILRESKKGEKLTTLDGKVNELPGKDIVITDGEGRLIDLCGVMGGSLSEVDQNTTNVLLFVPTYEPKHIRRTSLAVQNRTLASQIYEKSPDTELSLPTLVLGVQMLQQRCGGTISSNVLDYYPQKPIAKTIELDPQKVSKLIGVEISAQKQHEILKALGFTTQEDMLVQVPTWRLHEINIVEDLVEEIARVYGYFRLPGKIPTTSTNEVPEFGLLDWELVAKKHLSKLGFTEILSSSLTSKATSNKCNLNLEHSLRLTNPLSEDYEYLRTSLVPGILETLNQNRISNNIKIFELSNVYHKEDKKLPSEISYLCLATTDLDFRTTKGFVESLGSKLHITFDFQPLNVNTPPFTTTQSATITVNNTVVGYIGTITPQVTANFSLSSNVIVAQLNFQELAKVANPIHVAKALPQFPSIFEDITVESSLPIGELVQKITRANKILINVAYLTSLSNKHTFRLEFNHPDRSLTQSEVNQIREKIITAV